MASLRTSILLFCVVLSLGLLAQPNIASLLQSDKLKAGTSFTSINTKVDTSKKSYLVVFPPKFEVYYDTIKVAKETWLNKRIDLVLMTQTLEQKPAHVSWFFRQMDDTLAVKCMKNGSYEYEDFIMIGNNANDYLVLLEMPMA